MINFFMKKETKDKGMTLPWLIHHGVHRASILGCRWHHFLHWRGYSTAAEGAH
jgi:NADH:ubiquinone oxidoreductase subunit